MVALTLCTCICVLLTDDINQIALPRSLLPGTTAVVLKCRYSTTLTWLPMQLTLGPHLPSDDLFQGEL